MDLFIGSTDLSCEEKQTILDEHNRLRQLVALGQINGQPSAANMREMVRNKAIQTSRLFIFLQRTICT